jgi:hypothetical protein
MKNRLGETIYLTGFNHFVRGNAVCLRNGGVVILAGPTTLALPEKDPSLAVTASVATQLITITLNEALPWFTTATCFMAIFQGQPQSPTRNFFNGPWKFAGAIPANQGDPHTVAAPYTLVLGQKVWCYARIQLADGRLSEPMTVSCTVAA